MALRRGWRGSRRFSASAVSLVSRRQHLTDRNALDVEDQVRVCRDVGECPVAVRQLGGDREAALTSSAHADNTNIPALDDLADTELEGKRLALLIGCGLR